MNLPAYRHYRKRLFTSLFAPLSNESESYRRELVVNTILASLSGFAGLALLSSVQHHMQIDDANAGSLVINGVFLGIMLFAWRLSRIGHYQVAAGIIVTLLTLTTLQLTIGYGFELPVVGLLYALTVVVAGILFSTRVALITTALLSMLLVIVAYAEVSHHVRPDLSWRAEGQEAGDAVANVAILGIIGLVSWLANRQIDQALSRAGLSEKALAAERDSLEIKVVERTRSLEESQLLRSMELQRFAEFGRLSASLLHEVASPLTAASLNLEQLAGRKSASVMQAQKNLQHIERYVTAARKQLQNQTSQTRFSIKAEMIQITNILQPLARNNQVELIIQQTGSYWLFGDPVKFNQLLANLIVNAIDAYKDSAKPLKTKQIIVNVTASPQAVNITVRDWGAGITKDQLSHIFRPFYTTKGDTSRGMGIGLAIVKQYVETEFDGTISVTSDATVGTIFAITLKRSTSKR
jgi:signal transduction histidine kinase